MSYPPRPRRKSQIDDDNDYGTPPQGVSINTILKLVVWWSLLFVLYRFCVLDAKDPWKCGAVLKEGRWLDPPTDASKGLTNWQPPGCMMHPYASKDMVKCLRNRRVVLAGDSNIRNVFWAMARILDPESAAAITAEKHSNIGFAAKGVQLEFIWDPYVNGSQIYTELEQFGQKTLNNSYFDGDIPAIMVLGSGLWYARYVTINPLKEWRDNIDRIAKHMDSGPRSMDMTFSDLIMLSPVAVPAWELLSQSRKDTIDRSMVNDMNSYLKQLSAFQGLNVLQSWNAMTKRYPNSAFDENGLHANAIVAERQADVLLNLRCNAEIADNFSHNKTCCTRYKAPNRLQWSILIATLIVLPLWLVMRKDLVLNVPSPQYRIPSETLYSLLVFSLIGVFCFYCDRTQVYNKKDKQWSSSDFGFLTIVIIVVGFATMRTSPKDLAFLSRDQTDEWKGWMQFAILIYHYTGGSKIASIYSLIRLMVASYLFMTGFGHTVFFYKKADYSFKRVAGVMVRLNLLSCFLPYIMQSDYLDYYFAPLVSFWFFLVYFTMKIRSTNNQSFRFLLGKFAVSAIIVTIFTKVPFFLNTIFMLLGTVCKMEWDVVEWRFRVFLDMWIVYSGMITAVLFAKVSEGTLPIRPHHHRVAIITSLLVLPSFLVYQYTIKNKLAYNTIHPYLSSIPIIAFIILRNATQRLRNVHSAVFAWLGKISLETFTLQFHIWLAADTKGLLDLGIFAPDPWGDRWNFILVTVIFLYLSWCMASVTGDITAWILKTKSIPNSYIAPNGGTGSSSTKEIEEGKDGFELLQTGVVHTLPSSQIQGRIELWWQDLRIRLGIVMGVMWLLNLIFAR